MRTQNALFHTGKPQRAALEEKSAGDAVADLLEQPLLINLLVPVEGTPMAGATSVFYGEAILATGNPAFAENQMIFQRIGLCAQ